MNDTKPSRWAKIIKFLTRSNGTSDSALTNEQGDKPSAKRRIGPISIRISIALFGILIGHVSASLFNKGDDGPKHEIDLTITPDPESPIAPFLPDTLIHKDVDVPR